MKKLIFATTILLSQQAFAGVLPNWMVSRDYQEIESSNGATLYKSNDDSFHAIYVDLGKAQLHFGRAEDTGNTNTWDHKLFRRKNQNEFWNDYATSITFGFVNGQFFNNDNNHKYSTPISFPLQSHWSTYQKSIDGNRNIYSLYVKSGKYYLKNSYSSNDLKYTQNLITGWHLTEMSHPFESGIKDNFTHIGVIPKDSRCIATKSTCEAKALIFMISENEYLLSGPYELYKKWNVSYDNIIRLDSGGSTQYKTRSESFWEDKAKYKTPRTLPHMIEIQDRQSCAPGFSC
ncbi:MAG: hypothetical protein GY828_05290 [Candidatus Gracilibacteria bacterium]|nr:hypothetical protein [Candidatus Gracilibacteria bacterium]